MVAIILTIFLFFVLMCGIVELKEDIKSLKKDNDNFMEQISELKQSNKLLVTKEVSDQMDKNLVGRLEAFNKINKVNKGE